MEYFHQGGIIQAVGVNDPAVILTMAVLHFGADFSQRPGHVPGGERRGWRKLSGTI